MGISPSINMLKQEIDASLSNLSVEALKEILDYLEFVRFKFKKSNSSSTPYKPIALGGLWKDQVIEDKDIDEVRQEMWKDFGNREL